jgi:hypothetical protein
MSNHTSPQTKRQRIRKLILAEVKLGDIVNQVGTTLEYVYKERGKMKREGLLVTQQSLSISNGKREITVFKERPNLVENIDIDRPTQSHRVNDYNIAPLDKNDLMTMYEDFQNQKSPLDVIAKHGIHPEIVQREFERFLIMKSRDPYVLQQRLASNISDATPEIQALVDKSSSVLLTNDELLSIAKQMNWNSTYLYIRSLLANPALLLPDGLYGVLCMVCKKRLPGLIYDSNTAFGRSARMIMGKGNLCDYCLLRHVTPSG